MSAPLYALASDFAQLEAACVDDETGEVTDDSALLAAFDACSGSLAAKVDAVCKRRADALAMQSAAETEIKRLRARALAGAAMAERMEWLVGEALRRTGKRELRGELFTARVQENPKRVVIDDESALPPRFVQVETRPKKAEISAALKAGEEVPGAHLENSTSVRIR